MNEAIQGNCELSLSGQRLRLEATFPGGEQHVLFFRPYMFRPMDQLISCKSNCKNLATALEMYSADNGGRYPPTGQLETKLISGNYLKLIPTCPAAGTNTYSATYRARAKPDSFSFQCAGNNHSKAYEHFPGRADNFPQYDAEQGLVDHP